MPARRQCGKSNEIEQTWIGAETNAKLRLLTLVILICVVCTPGQWEEDRCEGRAEQKCAATLRPG